MVRPRISFRIVLLGLLLACIVPTGVGLSVSAFLNSRETVRLMWSDLAGELVENASEKTLRYFEPGPPQLRFQRQMVLDGALDVSDTEELLSVLLRCIKAQKAVTWCSFGGVDGSYLSAYRTETGSIRLTDRRQVDGGALVSDLELSGDEWRALPPVVKEFDPRRRPWWKVGLSAKDPTWSPPFLFSSRNQPGVALTLRQENPAAPTETLGVWLVEYELSHFDRFLFENKKNAPRGGALSTADVAILAADGTVLGYSGGMNVKAEGENQVLLSASEHPDALLREAFARVLSMGGLRETHRFSFGPRLGLPGLSPPASFLAVSAPFSGEGPGVSTLVIVPTKALLGPVFANNRWAALIAAVVALLCVVLGIFVAERFVRRLFQ